MTPLHRRALAQLRAAGLEIQVIPGPGPVSGKAWAEPGKDGQKTKLHIQIRGSTRSEIWLFVLFHEIAHHSLGHTTVWTSKPHWLQEYETDQYALKMLAQWQPAAVPRCEELSRRHIRPMLQGYIDADLWHHVDLDIARWAGCTLPRDMKGSAKEPRPKWRGCR